MLESLIAKVGIASEVGDMLGYGVNESLDDTICGYAILFAVSGLIIYNGVKLAIQADNDNKDG